MTHEKLIQQMDQKLQFPGLSNTWTLPPVAPGSFQRYFDAVDGNPPVEISAAVGVRGLRSDRGSWHRLPANRKTPASLGVRFRRADACDIGDASAGLSPDHEEYGLSMRFCHGSHPSARNGRDYWHNGTAASTNCRPLIPTARQRLDRIYLSD